MRKTEMKIGSIGSLCAETRARVSRMMGVPAALAVICLALPGAAAAQGVCNNAQLRGEYGALLQGVRGISAPGAPLVTEMFVGIALRRFDGNGGFVEEMASQHGATTGLQGGVGVKGLGVAGGTYQVNPDCTGTSTLVIPVAPGFNLTVVSDFVIVNNGKGINEIVTSPAANIVTAVWTAK